jgi:hypothetical protein
VLLSPTCDVLRYLYLPVLILSSRMRGEFAANVRIPDTNPRLKTDVIWSLVGGAA